MPKPHPSLLGAVSLGLVAATPGRAGDQVFGLPHTPVGDAVIWTDDEHLIVSGFDASGDDGVTIGLGDADGWTAAVDFGAAGALPTGARLRIESSFTADGAAHVAALSIMEAAGLASVMLEDVGCTCSVVTELRLGGAVVDSRALASPPWDFIAFGMLGSIKGEAPTLRTERAGAEETPRAFVVTLSSPAPLSLTGGAVMLADELRVRLIGPGVGVTSSHAVTLTGANLAALEVGAEALVQFGVDHRTDAHAELEIAGTLDDDGGPDVTGTSAGADSLELTPAEATTGPVGAIDLRFRFLTTWPDLAAMTRTTRALYADGSVGDLAFNVIDGALSCGCAYLARIGHPGDTFDRMLVARRRGKIVHTSPLPMDRAFTTPLDGRPSEWSIALVPDAPPGRVRYRVTWRWDEPALLTLYEGLVTDYVDEVVVSVEDAVGEAGAPIELVNTSLGMWGFGDPTSFIIDDVAHRPLATPCPGDATSDGLVGQDDLVLLLALWGQPCPACPVDFDGDGDVGMHDLLAVLAHWGACGGA